MTKPTLGVDFFSINGIPSDVDAMAAAFPFGWYQISNGMEVNIMTRLAWPTYAKHYGPYFFFNPYPGDNWMYQSFLVYAEEAARLFVQVLNGNFGACPPMIDVEQNFTDATLALLYPGGTIAANRAKGNQLFMQMLKITSDTIESLTGKIPVIYTGYFFWSAFNTSDTAWAARNPLCLASYPYDNYSSQSAYLTALQGIMSGAVTLPAAYVPAPWASATWQQFTGKAPASLIPGYAKESNWANTVDMSILKVVAPVPPISTNTYLTTVAVNVHSAPSGTSSIIAILPQKTEVQVYGTPTAGYSRISADGVTPQQWVYSSYLIKEVD